MNFLVTWAINIDADSPQEAAEMARDYQTRPDTTAVVFEVTEADKPGAVPVTVDLLAD